jgi:hypothetical protein
MGWCTTSDLDRFAAAAGSYLVSRAAENTLLLTAAQSGKTEVGKTEVGNTRAAPPAPAVRPRPSAGLLFGWWEPSEGSEPRGAFVHDPAQPLLISGRAPEMAAALAGTLSKLGRLVNGVDAPVVVADAFAAAWSERSHTTIRVHRHSRVYRLAAADPGADTGLGAFPGPVPWPVGQLRFATADDLGLLADWLAAFAAESAERVTAPREAAADLIGYCGAVFWEVPTHVRGYQPVALATLTRPVAGTVRIAALYTPQDRRGHGFAAAVTLAVSRAVLARDGVSEVVLITDMNRPERWAGLLGYQLVGERAVLRFGPATGPIPRLKQTGPAPRLRT